MKKKLLLVAALAVAISSCTNEQPTSLSSAQGDVVLSLSGKTTGVVNVSTRVGDNFPATNVGVYAMESSATVTNTSLANALYTVDDAGLFNSASPLKLNSKYAYTVCAYAPQGVVSNVEAVPFTHGVDVLYATAVPVAFTAANFPVAPPTASASLVFSHKMAQIKVSLKAGVGIQNSDLETATVKVSGFNESCTLNLVDGTIKPILGAGALITKAGEATCFIPNEKETKYSVSIMIGTREYTGDIVCASKGNESYSYTLTINKNDAIVGITGKIVDWTNVPGAEIQVHG